MQGFETIINSIITLGLAMLVGFISVKTKYISKEQNNGMSKIVVRVTLPMLVITSLTSLDFDREKLADELLPPYYKNLIVSPKNTDAMISDISGIISAGLNMAFQPGLCYEDAIIFRN